MAKHEFIAVEVPVRKKSRLQPPWLWTSCQQSPGGTRLKATQQKHQRFHGLRATDAMIFMQNGVRINAIDVRDDFAMFGAWHR